jgi:hypothetical protein
MAAEILMRAPRARGIDIVTHGPRRRFANDTTEAVVVFVVVFAVSAEGRRVFVVVLVVSEGRRGFCLRVLPCGEAAFVPFVRQKFISKLI